MKYFLPNKIKFSLIFLITFLSIQTASSQTIGRPSREGPDSSAKICANPDFNDFKIESSFTGDFDDDNVFSLLLSDVEGNFDDAEVIATTGTDNVTSEIRFVIFISEFLNSFEGSDNFKLKIVSSQYPEEEVFSQNREVPIYYVDFDSETETMSLDTNPDRLCNSGGTILAEPNDLGEGVYQWFRADVGGDNETLIDGEGSSSIEVSGVGIYYFKINVGACNNVGGNFSRAATSNFTTVEATNGIPVSIEGSSTRIICSEKEEELKSSVDDSTNSYQWFKDGEALNDIDSDDFTVSGSNSPTLTVSGIDGEGIYTLSVAAGAIGECTTQSDPVTIELLNPKISITSETTVILLPPGEPKTITAEVIRGDNPVIMWFKDGIAIDDSDTTNLEVTEEGTYTVSLMADSLCKEDNTVSAIEEIEVFATESLSLVIDYNDATYQDCALNEVILQITEVTAIVEGTSIMLEAGTIDELEVDWMKDGISTGETESSILINSASENGSYTASIQGDFVSNSLSVIIALDSFEIIKTPETLPLGGELELSLGLENETGYTFQWIRNNIEEIDNSNSSTITINQPGLYSVQVFFDSCGSVTVPGVTVNTGSQVIPNVITPNGDGINDAWVLTSELTLNDEVEINIYASNGELDYSGTNYDGQWPEESSSNAIGTIYYYVISMNNNPIEQGSITIIR